MPLSIARPTAERVQRFLDEQRALPFSYAEVGATLATPPSGFELDHNRAHIGHGRECFECACRALRSWRMFDLGWVDVADHAAPIETGTCVAILARVLGVWSLNACRIVRVVESRTIDVERFGFCYGTLPGHVECGEERFTIELDPRTGDVTYDILAFSKPRPWWARAAKPCLRRLQRRFARDSISVMRRHAAGGEEPRTP